MQSFKKRIEKKMYCHAPDDDQQCHASSFQLFCWHRCIIIISCCTAWNSPHFPTPLTTCNLNSATTAFFIDLWLLLSLERTTELLRSVVHVAQRFIFSRQSRKPDDEDSWLIASQRKKIIWNSFSSFFIQTIFSFIILLHMPIIFLANLPACAEPFYFIWYVWRHLLYG